MNYKDAFAIGSHVEGYIKCHYAELHSPTLGKLFSLQDTNFTTKNQAAQMIGAGYDQNPNVDDHIFIAYDVPVVETVDFEDYDETLPKAQQLVPVRLTKIAREILINYFSQRKWILYTVYWSRIQGGEAQKTTRKEILKTYDRNEAYSYINTNLDHYDVEEEKQIRPQYQALIDGINENGVFYVKPVAIDWIPTDIVNVGLDDEIAAAQKRLDAAKAILLTAAGAAVIL